MSAAKRYLSLGLVGIAGVLAAFSLVFTIYWIPGSRESSRLFSISKGILTSNPAGSFNAMMGAIKTFPFDLEPRREAFKPLVNVLATGGSAELSAVDSLYRISREAAGNTPDLLLARIYYFINIAKLRDADARAEIAGLIESLARVNPRFEDIEKMKAVMAESAPS